MSRGKRYTTAIGTVDREKVYPLDEAVKIVKANAKAKFDETIEVAMNLGIDPRHADQAVRGMIALPNGTGKSVRVAGFARRAKAEPPEPGKQRFTERWGVAEAYTWSEDKARQYSVPERHSFGPYVRRQGFALK